MCFSLNKWENITYFLITYYLANSRSLQWGGRPENYTGYNFRHIFQISNFNSLKVRQSDKNLTQRSDFSK